MEKVIISTPSIQLDQFLKWVGIIESGGQVRFLLEEKLISVNGEIATQKRKKLVPGDVVEFHGEGSWLVTAE